MSAHVFHDLFFMEIEALFAVAVVMDIHRKYSSLADLV